MKLWMRVFAVFAALGLGAVAILVLLQQRSFREGLLEYVNAHDRTRVVALRMQLAARYRTTGDWSFLRSEVPQVFAAAGIEPPRPRHRREEGPPGRRPPPPRPPPDGVDRPPPEFEQPPPPGAAGDWQRGRDERPRRRPPEDGWAPLENERLPSPGTADSWQRGREGGRPRPREDDWAPPGAAAAGNAPLQETERTREGNRRRPPPLEDEDEGGAAEAGTRGGKVRPPPAELAARICVEDVSRQRVIGHIPPGLAYEDYPIEAFGKVVGYLRFAPLTTLQEGLDLAFARTQLRSAAWAAGVVLLGVVLLSFGFARGLLSPLRAFTDAVRSLAAGDYEKRLPVRRSDEFGQLAGDLNRLAQALERNRQASREWIADISHELRTPLSVLTGELHALQDGVRPLSPEAVGSLLDEAGRIGRLVEDLYQLSLADAGTLNYRFEEVDLGELCAEAAERNTRKLAAARLSLTVNAADGGLPLRADATRLGQLLDNLLQNSVRYTDPEGRVVLSAEAVAGGYRIICEDTAPGVPPEALPRLFERLYRVERSRSRAAGGAGLGLSICRAIVEGHGGTISASASPLGGLRVEVWLPAEGR